MNRELFNRYVQGFIHAANDHSIKYPEPPQDSSQALKVYYSAQVYAAQQIVAAHIADPQARRFATEAYRENYGTVDPATGHIVGARILATARELPPIGRTPQEQPALDRYLAATGYQVAVNRTLAAFNAGARVEEEHTHIVNDKNGVRRVIEGNLPEGWRIIDGIPRVRLDGPMQELLNKSLDDGRGSSRSRSHHISAREVGELSPGDTPPKGATSPARHA